MTPPLAVIIGWPVAHSLSPAMHNAAFEASGLGWRYVPMAVHPSSLAAAIGQLRELGIRGLNVTMPHKQAIIPLLNALAEDAASVRAVNTVMIGDGRWIGRNTDGRGFLRALAADAGWTPEGASAAVIGAGGAARAVAVALAGGGASVAVTARRPDQAAEVAALHERIRVVGWGEQLTADLIVQATPSRDGLPLEGLGFGPSTVAVDLIYPPPETPFVQAARAAGAATFDGMGMLIHQAAMSFEIWTGLSAPVEVMAGAARRALAARRD